MERQRRTVGNGRIGRGLLLSIILHAQILVPFLIAVFWLGRSDNNEIDLSFESVKDEDLPPDLPSIEDLPKPERKAKPPSSGKPEQVRLPARQKREPQREPEIPMPLPTPAPVPPKPEAKVEAKPVAPPPEKLHQKIVELDLGKEVEAPKDAKYLAQKNNRTEHETRARETNLDKEQQGKQSQPSDNEDKIGHLDDQEAQPGHESRKQATAESSMPQGGSSPLSMRGPGSDATKSQRELVERSPDGWQVVPDDAGGGSRGPRGGSEAERLQLSRRQYESAFGDDATAAAAFAKQERSKRKGRFAERQARVLSALENFIPEVNPGNTTELNTRAAPFAQFITRMHRRIHEQWAFGFLSQMDRSFKASRMDDPHLVAKLEIVLDGKGNIDKVAMVRTSGLTGYDIAAINSVYSAAPFPEPPSAILSGNGKVYVHWTFHRNEEACGTMGVDYFILDNAPKSGKKATAHDARRALGS